MNKERAAFIFIISVFVIALAYLNHTRLSNDSRPPYRNKDSNIVNIAQGKFAAENNKPVKVVMQGRYSIAARTEKGRCVNIVPENGLVGFVRVYCFDEDGQITFSGSF